MSDHSSPEGTTSVLSWYGKCEQVQVTQVLGYLGQVPLRQTIDLANRETIYVDECEVFEDDPTLVVRHRRTNLTQQREDQYFVLHTAANPPELLCAVDDLHGEQALIEEGAFDQIKAHRQQLMEIAVQQALPADSHEADELSRILRQVVRH